MTPRLEELALSLANAHAEFIVRLRASGAALEDLGANAHCAQREERAIHLLRALDDSKDALLRAHAQLVAGSHQRGPEASSRLASLATHVDALVGPLFGH